VLTAADVLDPVPRRVLIAGVTGAGKTTLARRVSEVLGVPHTELDSLYHGAGWVPRPSFAEDVQALVEQPAWVTEWQYTEVRGLLASRADTLVWLDLPPRVPLWRVLRRTLTRRIRLTVLWNGNVEPPLHTILRNPITFCAGPAHAALDARTGALSGAGAPSAPHRAAPQRPRRRPVDRHARGSRL